MRAVSRFGNLLLAGALALAPSTALAQEAPPPADAQAPADTVGPKELQNFSLNGTVTHAAEQPAPIQAPPARREPRTQTQAETAPQTATAQPSAPSTPRRSASVARAPAPPTQSAQPAEALQQQPAPAPSVTGSLSGFGTPAAANRPASPLSAAPFAADPPATGTLATEHKFPVIPWLLAALALVLGGAFLFWRNRGREIFAGGPQVAAFVPPVPVPAPGRTPEPTSAAPKAAAPSPASPGFVSTRLRPWIDIGFNPLRCVLDEERVTIEFELELFNSGSAPARAVLAEASLFNAGPQQDQEIAAFFANPVGQGERIVVIPPLQRVALKTQVVGPRAQLQAFELAGRPAFLPLIAFNALYRWNGGEGQTSASYLLGRDTKGEKMAPFRLDLGPRIFRGVGARILPTGIRR